MGCFIIKTILKLNKVGFREGFLWFMPSFSKLFCLCFMLTFDKEKLVLDMPMLFKKFLWFFKLLNKKRLQLKDMSLTMLKCLT